MKNRIKLTDICRPKQWKTIPANELQDNGYPVYGANGIIGYYKDYNHEKSVVAITCRGATCGSVNLTLPQSYVTGNAMCLDDVCKDVMLEYLYYCLKHYNFTKVISGSAQPQITRKDMEKIYINIYEYDEQIEIVNNLRKAEKVVSYRIEELKLLDNLVKARFVEMFGDPVLNTKKWPTEFMDKIAPTVNYAGDFDEKVWLLNLDMVEPNTGRIIDYHIVEKSEVGNSTCTFDTTNVLYSKLRPYLNKVVIPDRPGYATSELIALQPVLTKINREYLAFMLRSNSFVRMINNKVAGAKMPRVSMVDFKKINVPTPPLELQNEFADFVKQVDKSKFESVATRVFINYSFEI